MHFDICSVTDYRDRRLLETIEDGYSLICFQIPTLAARLDLRRIYPLFAGSEVKVKKQLTRDPKTGMWFTVDLSPIVENPATKEAQELAEEIGNHILHVCMGAALLQHQEFVAALKPMPSGSFIPGNSFALRFSDKFQSSVEFRCESEGTVTVNGSATQRMPLLEIARFAIPLSDPVLVPPPLNGYALSEINSVKVANWIEILTKVENLLERSDTASTLVSNFGKFLLPLQGSPCGAHLSVSFKSRPGIIYASSSTCHLEIAEALVHEADHQSLYEVINEGALFTDDNINSACIFRSPWRPDPRPLSGLYFGFGAFVTVGCFWADLLATSEADASFIGKRAVLALEQSLDAISLVQGNGILTQRGLDLLEFNREKARDALDSMKMHPAFSSWKKWSADRLRTHSVEWFHQFGVNAKIGSVSELESP